jgi:hypothetical protein
VNAKRVAHAISFVVLQGCGSCSGETAAPARDASPPKHDASKVEAAAPEAGPERSFEALPDGGAADLQLRGKHLLQAIAENDPSLAADIILPREAYIAARDAEDPGAVYESRVKSAFASQIVRIRRHEKGIDGAVFVSFDLGGPPVRVEPRRHEWKDAVWKIGHSKLTFTIEGRVKRIDVAEMIAWRGNWYVARLRGHR